MEQIETGKVKAVVVKDMSRLGRDYLKVGFYTEVLFPEKNVRFIAINNGIDSNNQQDSDFTPFLNIINEWYAKDTSKSFETWQDHFVCSTSRLKRVETCSTHFIRAVVLEEMVLWHLQYITSFVTAYGDIFREKMNAKYTTDRKKETALRRKQIAQAERRISELSKLFKRMYEDNVNGKLNDIRFEELSADYFE